MLNLQNAIESLPHADFRQLENINADPNDVCTPDNIIDALWDSYSAKAGERNWERLRSLFYPNAGSNMVIHPVANGEMDIGILSNHQAYRDWSKDMLSENNLFEWEFKRKIEQWGHTAHVVASVAVGNEPRGEPFGYALQNILLYWDKRRWWILSILIEAVTPENPFPLEFKP